MYNHVQLAIIVMEVLAYKEQDNCVEVPIVVTDKSASIINAKQLVEVSIVFILNNV
jgi:hypothetical protein